MNDKNNSDEKQLDQSLEDPHRNLIRPGEELQGHAQKKFKGESTEIPPDQPNPIAQLFRCSSKCSTTDEEITEELKKRFKKLIQINSLLEQQKVFGTAQKKPLPLFTENCIFDFFLFNPLVEEFERFHNAIRPTSGEKKTNVHYLNQVSGSSKTKFAYELTNHGYVVFVSFNQLHPPVRTLLEATNRYKNLQTVDDRFSFTEYSLCVVYAWIYAHFKFLEYYLNEIVKEEPDLSEVQKQQYFHMLQVNRSYYYGYFLENQFHSILDEWFYPAANSSIALSTITAKFAEIWGSTKTYAIVFDGLLNWKKFGLGCFAHQKYAQYSKEAQVYIQEREMATYRSQAIVCTVQTKPADVEIPKSATSVLTGLLTFIQSVQSYSPPIVMISCRPISNLENETTEQLKIQKFVPNAYITPKDMIKFLEFYFEIDASELNLKKDLFFNFKGRGLFFFDMFFMKTLCSKLGDRKPSEEEFLSLLKVCLREQEKCKNRAEDFVRHFLRQPEAKNVLPEIKRSLLFAAGKIPLDKQIVEKRIGQMLGFINEDYCQINEPFIIEAFLENTQEIDEDFPPEEVNLRYLE